MDGVGDWRVIDPDEDDAAARRGPEPASNAQEKVPRWLVATIVAIIGAALALAIWATLPSGTVDIESSAAAANPLIAVNELRTPFGSFAAAAGGRSSLVVDVEGAVVEPGVHELGMNSRIGDAIAAAGGYALDADIEAAARSLNLAAKLTDGQQIHVPALGEQTRIAPFASGGADDGGGPSVNRLVDINHASADELDTLPGIGPVTAAKIIDARTQTLFATIDELQSRGVVGQSTFDKLRDLITVTP